MSGAAAMLNLKHGILTYILPDPTDDTLDPKVGFQSPDDGCAFMSNLNGHYREFDTDSTCVPSNLASDHLG